MTWPYLQNTDLRARVNKRALQMEERGEWKDFWFGHQIQGLVHAKQVLHHSATSPDRRRKRRLAHRVRELRWKRLPASLCFGSLSANSSGLISEVLSLVAHMQDNIFKKYIRRDFLCFKGQRDKWFSLVCCYPFSLGDLRTLKKYL